MEILKHKSIFFLLSASLMTLGSCSTSNTPPPAKYNQTKTIEEAFAILHPTKGNNVKGKISFTKVANGVRVVGDFEGLVPGEHGLHIHEKGDCSAPDGSSAGAHFNPTHKKHGGPDDADRHVGDLGNLNADRNGRAHYERIDQVISLEGENSIVGRSVIVHTKKDDFTTQPTGDSGERVSCGVIETLH